MPAPTTRRPIIVPQQLSLLEDTQGQSLQSRFEDFCRTAVACLTVTNDHGDPCFEAGKAKCKMLIEVTVIRTANDALSFAMSDQVKTKHPHLPGRGKTTVFVDKVGLAQQLTDRQLALFDPTRGQPQPLSENEAASVLEE